MKLSLFTLFSLSLFGMELIEFLPEKLYDVVPLEQTAYLQLINDPVDDNVTYVAVPWCWIRNNSAYGLLENPSIAHSETEAFTVAQDILFANLIPWMKKFGVTTIFTPQAAAAEINGVRIVPFPLFPVNTCDPADEKDILFSFIGWGATHHTRPQFAQFAAIPDAVIIFRDGWFSGFNKDHKTEYLDILARSRYSLCPRGTGPNSIRFYESLKAGAIPVVISDDLILPAGIDTPEAIVRVKESEIHTIPGRLSAITLAEEVAMRERCIQFFYEYVDGENFTRLIHEHFRTK